MGDAHANRPENRRALFAAYRASNADVALQTGDLEYYRLPMKTYFIGGNNEDFDIIESLRHGRIRSSKVKNAKLLHSTARTIQGCRIAGISGNYAPTCFDMSRSNLKGERRRHFVKSDVERAKSLSNVDVFLAHEAPHGTPVEEEYDVGNKYIDEILKE
ncbi:MAG: metallophosphoesterase, partial [Halobacteriaceae archaeon]